MTKRIAIIQGHPDPVGNHFLHALAAAYAEGAQAQGHAVRTLDVAQMAFPLLRTKEEYEQGPPPEAIVKAQETIAWAGHLVVFYPLWLGTMPALLKGFFEQVLRPGFAYPPPQDAGMMKGLLKGRSARIVVTMGMPALILSLVLRSAQPQELGAQRPQVLRCRSREGDADRDGRSR
jgi:putative NADPH-quinone reductase